MTSQMQTTPIQTDKLRQAFLYIALFVGSAGGLVVEIVAGRLIAPYVGMSLYTWTAIIAVVLAGLSGGHWVGGLMARADVTYATASRRLAISFALASVSTLASLLLLRVLSTPLMTSGLGAITVVILLCSLIFFLPSFFIGIVAPILMKLSLDGRAEDPGPMIGRMYAIGTFGSIAGTLAAGYLFISWIGSNGTIVAVAVCYAVLAIMSVLQARPQGGATVTAATILTLIGLSAIGYQVQAFASPCARESDYYCVRLDDFSPVSGRPSTLMALDHLVHSINDREDPGLLYSPYIHFVDEYARRRLGWRDGQSKPSAYFIGGGGFSLPRAWANAFPGARLLVAEIDPVVTSAAADRMWLDLNDTAMEIHHRDGRVLLQSLPATPQFDTIFGDAFHDISVPTHLVTREFHQEIAVRLTADGFYVINAVDRARDPQFLTALITTLRQDFSSVEIWLEEDAAFQTSDPNARITYIVVASNRDSGVGQLLAQNGAARLWVRRRPESVLAAGVSVTFTDNFAPVDRLMAPLMNQPPE